MTGVGAATAAASLRGKWLCSMQELPPASLVAKEHIDRSSICAKAKQRHLQRLRRLPAALDEQPGRARVAAADVRHQPHHALVLLHLPAAAPKQAVHALSTCLLRNTL